MVGRALCVIACLQGCVLFFFFVPVCWAVFECVVRVRAWDWSCPTVSILVWIEVRCVAGEGSKERGVWITF
jgi:hypothetical protein